MCHLAPLHSGTDPKANLKFHGPPPTNSGIVLIAFETYQIYHSIFFLLLYLIYDDLYVTGSSPSPSFAPSPPLKGPDSPVPSQAQRSKFNKLVFFVKGSEVA